MAIKYAIHKAKDRGHSDHGWLKANFSFSFANYYNPKRMGFGAMRVFNDDVIEKNSGFPMHSHQNMEIISIINKGEIFHEDSAGHSDSITPGQIQVMSAGTGITHSEMVGNDYVESLQIWIEPRKYNIAPRYNKFDLDNLEENKLNLIISDELNYFKNTQKINQNAYFLIGEFNSERIIKYSNYKNGNGIFIFIINGEIKFDNNKVCEKDSLEIVDTDYIEFKVLKNTKVLLIEVEMND